jgi:hypothetical protein
MARAKTIEHFTDSTNRRWMNSSVVALMNDRAEPQETPPVTIRRLARKMIKDAKEQGWNEIPFDPEILAELQGIEVVAATTDIHAEARLMPLPDHRLKIEYAPTAPETRRRFSICHELAHTFFPDCFEQVQHRRKDTRHDPVHAELEQLCHIGAGELLMPLDEFLNAAKHRRPSIQVADELGKTFKASQEAALRRLVDLSPEPYCLVWASEGFRQSEKRDTEPEWDFGFEAPKAKLRVDYQFNSLSWRPFIPKNKSFPESSLVHSVARGEAYETSTEDWSDLKVGKVCWEAVGSKHKGPEHRGVMICLRAVS